MDEKQALDVINQGINLAVSNGAFKNSRDVAIISQALEVVAKFLAAANPATPDVPMPVKKITKAK